MAPVTQEELNMGKDAVWKKYFSDNHRYADIINGIGCKGKQLVKAADLCDADSRTGKKKDRDLLRRTAFGMNFALIGVENQETIDYSLPLRTMIYDTEEYEKQAAKIRKTVREEEKHLSAGEYLYGFKKDNRLKPVITFILYSGTEEWNGSRSLHEMIDFTGIPEYLKEMTPDYKINVIEIRKLENTECFKTDVRQVFDFIRCSEDDVALNELVKNDPYYQGMEEDAFDIAVLYTNATELIKVKDYYREDGKIDMCTAITKLIAEGREEGRNLGLQEGRSQGIREGRSQGIREGRSQGIREGRKQGIETGENLLANLMSCLFADNRIVDANLAANDEKARKRFYREYGLVDGQDE